MYTDLEIKHGGDKDIDKDKARNLMERALSIFSADKKKKKVITILKKYHQMEVGYGDEEAAERVLERAKEIAESMEKVNMDMDEELG